MQIEVTEIRGVAVARLRGKITIGPSEIAIRDCIQEVLSRGISRLIFDLAEVRTIDSSGVGELVSAFTTTTNRAALLWYARPPEGIVDILQITQLITVVPFFPTVEDAIESILEVSTGSSPDSRFPDQSAQQNLYLGASLLSELPEDLGDYRSLKRLFIYSSITTP